MWEEEEKEEEERQQQERKTNDCSQKLMKHDGNQAGKKQQHSSRLQLNLFIYSVDDGSASGAMLTGCRSSCWFPR